MNVHITKPGYHSKSGTVNDLIRLVSDAFCDFLDNIVFDKYIKIALKPVEAAYHMTVFK